MLKILIVRCPSFRFLRCKISVTGLGNIIKLSAACSIFNFVLVAENKTLFTELIGMEEVEVLLNNSRLLPENEILV